MHSEQVDTHAKKTHEKDTRKKHWGILEILKMVLN